MSGWCTCEGGPPSLRKTNVSISVCVVCGGVPRETVKKVSREYHQRRINELREEERLLTKMLALDKKVIQDFVEIAWMLNDDLDQTTQELLFGVLDGAELRRQIVQASLAREQGFAEKIDEPTEH